MNTTNRNKTVQIVAWKHKEKLHFLLLIINTVMSAVA